MVSPAKVPNAGIETMRQFSSFFTSVDDLRTVAKEELGIGPASLAQRVELSRLVVAWDPAKVGTTKMAEAEADAQVRQEAMPMRGTDITAIRINYEARWWTL